MTNILVLEIDLDWLEQQLGRENVNKIISALTSSNDNPRTSICLVDADFETGSCRPGNDSLIFDLLSSLVDD